MSLVAALLVTPVLQAGTLQEDGLELLQRLSAQGYSVTAMRTVQLVYLQPCTLPVYLPDTVGGGFFIGMGGDDVLDLYMEASGGRGWVLRDSLPDDLPILELTPALASDAQYAIITATDMLRDVIADSALFMYALERVDLQPSTGDVSPAQVENGGSE
jgi:hypothetical protein